LAVFANKAARRLDSNGLALALVGGAAKSELLLKVEAFDLKPHHLILLPRLILVRLPLNQSIHERLGILGPS
jgi:hypothetical protein